MRSGVFFFVLCGILDNMKNIIPAFSFLLASMCAVSAAEDSSVRIRKTAISPFSDGKRIESSWAKADELTGFIVVEKLDAAIDDTAVQFLYDDRNLYVSFKGYFEKGCRQKNGNGGMFNGNTFELYMSNSMDGTGSMHFAFSPDASAYCGRIIAGKEKKVPLPKGVRFNVTESAGGFVVNAEIPFASAGLGKVRDRMKIVLLPVRRNVCFRDGYSEHSVWGAVPSKDGVSDKSNWVEAVFSVKDDVGAKKIFPSCNGRQVNYYANPEFDVAGRSWKLEGKEQTMRCETMPMSREWIVRTVGGTYRFINGVPQRFERNTDYTLVVRARGFGGESQMNVLEICRRDGDGKMSEGTQVARHVLLGEDFHTYYFPFRSTNNGEPVNLVFYKWEPKNAANRGIDVASVRLVKGRVNALDLRKVSRNERKAPQGIGIPIDPNPYGRVSSPMRGLVFSLRLVERREILEIFEGTGIEVDILTTTSPNQDIYYTDDDIEAVKKRIDRKEYGFFFVMSHVAGNIGPLLSSNVLESVSSGAGLYFMNSPKKGHFDIPLKKAGLKLLSADHQMVRSYPSDMGCGVKNFKPTVLFKEGRIGRGRVFAEGSGRTGPIKFTMNQKCYGVTDFPYSSFADPLMVKILRYVSRDGGETVGSAIKTYWSAVDAWGMVRRSGEAVDEMAALEAAKVACDVSGRYAVALKSVDGKGRTLHWNARFFDKPGPHLALKEIRTSCNGDEPAVFSVEMKDSGDGRVRWTLEDFAGRVIESGMTKSGVQFEVPTRSLYTNKGVVRAYLESDGKLKAVARADIYARDRDWERLNNDFTVGIWGQGSSVSRETSAEINRLLIDHGILYHCNPVDYFTGNRNLTLALSSGMAVGGGYLGNGGWFFPKQLDESNVRSVFGPINTEKGHKEMADLAVKHATDVYRYGPIAYAVCDEPNLSLRFTKDEPDEEPENVAEFRRRMEAKYRNIQEYNRRHRTSHTSFLDVGPMRIENARKTGNFAEYVEWRNFNADRWCEAIKVLADNGAKVDPTCRLSLFNSFGQTAASGNDYWKLLTKAGLGFSNEYTSMVYMRRRAIYNFDEFYRSFRPDMRVWGFTGYNLNEPQIRFTPWWFAAHRYGGFTWFSVLTWDWRYFDQPTLAYTKDSMELKASLDSSRMQQGLGKLFLSYDWKPRQVAIYYSHDSLLTSTLIGTERVSYDVAAKGPLHDYMYSRQGLQYTVEDLLHQFDFVAPEQVLAGKLEGYRILFMPRILALSDAEVSRLKAFVAAGGKIVADQMPGDYDELGVKRPANPFSPSEVEVTGANFDDLSVAQRKRMLGFLDAAKAEPVLRSEGIEKVFGREAMHFTDGTNSVFIVLRMPLRSSDSETQTFVFPQKGHVYDVRAGRYIGYADRVTAAVPHAEASVWAVLPEKVGDMRVSVPRKVEAGTDLVANIALEGAAGKGVFHVELVSPSGDTRFHMKRNIDSVNGKAKLAFRIAENDRPGNWKIRVTDTLTGVRTESAFVVMP